MIVKTTDREGNKTFFKTNDGCPKCWGRGHIGKDLKTGKHILCKCLKKIDEKKSELEIKDRS